jgi:putative membrane protein
MTRLMMLSTAASLLLAGCGEETNKVAFVDKATFAGEFEIKSSELAKSKSTNAVVTSFADMMIADHTAAAKKLEAVAREIGVAADKSKSSPHADDMEDLEKATAEKFDAEYVEKQREAHEDAVELFKGYAEKGDDVKLKQFAAETLPTLQRHLDHVNGLKVN